MKSIGQRLNGLGWRLRAMRRLWRPGAQPVMTFLPPVRIPDTTAGKLDHPRPGFEFDEETIRFNGWVAFDSGQPVARVEGWLDGTSIGKARVSLPRPDVEESTELPLARLSGFDLAMEIALLPEPERTGHKALRVVATSAGEESFEFDPVPVVLAPRELITDEPARPTAPPRCPPAPQERLRILVFTHQLTLGGAQLYLLDLMRELRKGPGRDLTLVSVTDGPLRRDLEAMGIPIHMTAMAPREHLDAHLGRIGELAAWAGSGNFDIAFVNTATSGASFGAEVAWTLGIPAVWAIHESFPPGLLWADLQPKVREQTEATLAHARFALFEADSTRRIFEPLIGPERCLTLPYGVDIDPMERERRRLSLTSARQRAGILPDEEVVLCVGTVEPRKAQVPLAQAFSMIADAHPNARLVFVGGRKDDPNTKDLETVISELQMRERINVIPITPNVQAWYGIADILVCASDVESLPRTVLEAMIWDTPVLATDVFGMQELIDDSVTGWLCAARDLQALADGLDRALNAPPKERRRIATSARKLVEERHSLPHYAAKVLEVLETAVGEKIPSRSDEETEP